MSYSLVVRATLLVFASIAAVAACSLVYRVDDLPAPSGDAASADGKSDAPSAAMPFLRVAGTRFEADGRQTLVRGFDLVQAGNLTPCVCDGWQSDARIADALEAMRPGAANGVRVWFFQGVAQSGATSSFDGLDAVVRAAHDKGVYVFAVLGNQWATCDGPLRDEGFYQGGYKTTIVPGQTRTYLDWVKAVVSRYKDEPAIGAWMMMNDAIDSSDCGASIADEVQRFVSDVAATIKSIDGNHLVSPGETGERCDKIDGPAWRVMHADPNVDFCDTHEYDPTSSLSAPTVTRVAQCVALGKPILLSEVGLDADATKWTVTPGDLVARATLLDQKFVSGASAGMAGMLVYNFGCESPALHFDVGDPILPKMAAWSLP